MDERDERVIIMMMILINAPIYSHKPTLQIKPQKRKLRNAYLELDVELVVWDRVPMPVELGI